LSISGFGRGFFLGLTGVWYGAERSVSFKGCGGRAAALAEVVAVCKGWGAAVMDRGA